MPQPHGAAVPTTEERERAARALDLRKAGITWQAIADHLGYSDESGARKAVGRLLDRVDSEMAEEYRAVELARLDDLWRAWWPAALGRDEKATNILLRVHQARAKLLGLAMPDKLVLQQINVGMTAEEFTTRVDEDMRILGLSPTMDVPLQEGGGDDWANT